MAKFPRVPAAVISALQFTPGSGSALDSLSDADWDTLLQFSDKTQLTLVLSERHPGTFPPRVLEAVAKRRVSQNLRVQRTKESFIEIDAALRSAEIPFLVMKGFTHCPDFIGELNSRVQYDIDLYSTAEHHRRAHETLQTLGYEPLQALERFPLDHLPTLIRKTGWEWHNDFFDPELPLSVEVHFRFWDRETERLTVENLDDFWHRRVLRREHGLEFEALNRIDSLGYACLHLLRHLLRGDPKPLHLYEVANFLETHAMDETLWSARRDMHHDSLRRMEAICFNLASHVFACKLNASLEAEIEDLPESVRGWVSEVGDGPIDSWLRPNKNEIRLHMSLLESDRDRRAVFFRRLIPSRLPGPVDAVHIPEEKITRRIRVRKTWRYVAFVSARALHHTRTFFPTVANGLGWWLENLGTSAKFFRFLAAAAVFQLGLFVFYLLYNLFLLEQGFRETFLGANSAAMQAGAIAGAVPGGVAASRLGLRSALTWSLGALAVVSALRAIVAAPNYLLLLSFIGGMLSSAWMVAITPAVAELVPERARPSAFSLFIATGISVGILGGIVGGYLPVLVTSMGVASTDAKRTALLIGCALIASGALLISRIPLDSAAQPESRLYPKNPALLRFLIVIGAFSLGTGAFNPLYAAYLSSSAKLTVEGIGGVFALSQFMQVIAILLAPLIISRLGYSSAVSWMFAGTGVALFCLGLEPTGAAAALAYVAYMCFQYMSEPGTFSMLMSLVAPDDRRGASMLNFLVINGAQAIAAAAAGAAVTRFGYTPVLEGAAVFVLLAAVLFRLVVRATTDSIKSVT